VEFAKKIAIVLDQDPAEWQKAAFTMIFAADGPRSVAPTSGRWRAPSSASPSSPTISSRLRTTKPTEPQSQQCPPIS
jgi:hypothetical protein